MSTTTTMFTFVIKHPGNKAEPVSLPEGADFQKEVYRILQSSEGHPPERKPSRGDKSYPGYFKKPDLWVIYDEDQVYHPVNPSRWGIRGLIIITRVDDDHFVSLRPEEVAGVVADLEKEVPKDPDDWEQQMKNLGKYF